jgi:hypothetical protein
MNIIIKKEFFEKLYHTVLRYEAELKETVKCLHQDDEIQSMEAEIIELQATAHFMQRILKASAHGRDIKGQRNEVKL